MKTLSHPPLLAAGLDEVGRGPWAGPMVAAVVILPEHFTTRGIADSKALNEAQRERAYARITAQAWWGVGFVSHEEIDHFGLTLANAKAFRRALKALELHRCPSHLLVDGKTKYRLPYPATYIIGGDASIPCISAASIVAKVTRDRWMVRYALEHAEYAFDQHKGYGTSLHRQRIQTFGVGELHRRSYRPVQLFATTPLA